MSDNSLTVIGMYPTKFNTAILGSTRWILLTVIFSSTAPTRQAHWVLSGMLLQPLDGLPLNVVHIHSAQRMSPNDVVENRFITSMEKQE